MKPKAKYFVLSGMSEPSNIIFTQFDAPFSFCQLYILPRFKALRIFFPFINASRAFLDPSQKKYVISWIFNFAAEK